MACCCSPKCAGIFLLLLSILGLVINPLGPLWAFLAACVILCCNGVEKPGCARCLSVTGIVFCSITVIASIAVGAWMFTAQDAFCGLYKNAVDISCAIATNTNSSIFQATGSYSTAACSAAEVALDQGCSWLTTAGLAVLLV